MGSRLDVVRGLLLVVSLAVTACNADTRPRFLSEPLKTPISKDYRKSIADWAARYFVEPSSIHDAYISQPVPIRLFEGVDVWLVCVEMDARAKGAGYMGVHRIALAFNGPTLIAPLERSSLTVRNEDCNRQPLTWRRFVELERIR
jgi:hypothetical protein